MIQPKIVTDTDPHVAVKAVADSVFLGTIANPGDMQRIRKEARRRLIGHNPTDADELRMAGRIAYEEAFFLAQGAAFAEAALDNAVAAERKAKP
jgi:hypothetical protein